MPEYCAYKFAFVSFRRCFRFMAGGWITRLIKNIFKTNIAIMSVTVISRRPVAAHRWRNKPARSAFADGYAKSDCCALLISRDAMAIASCLRGSKMIGVNAIRTLRSVTRFILSVPLTSCHAAASFSPGFLLIHKERLSCRPRHMTSSVWWRSARISPVIKLTS